MLKRISIFLSSLILFSFIADENKDQVYIAWNKERPLLWSDFKDNPDTKSMYDAWTYFGIDYTYTWHYSDNEIKTDLNAFAYFDPQKSWVKKSKLSTELLAHEQLHFDIAELYCNYFEDAIHEFNYTHNVDAEIDSIFETHYSALLAKQIQYDQETNHFENKIEQERWNTYVHKELERTD